MSVGPESERDRPSEQTPKAGDSAFQPPVPGSPSLPHRGRCHTPERAAFAKVRL